MENKPGRITRSKRRRSGGFTTIANELLQDETVSYKARGILSYLISLPDDWVVYQKELEKRSPDGRTSVESGLKELIEAGYMRRTRRREQGKFAAYDYEFSEEKLFDDEIEEVEQPQKKQEKSASIPFEIIIGYLNEKAEKNFKHTTGSTRKSISGRFSDGYGLDDFMHVIDVKVQEWKGTEMDKFLSPETLFRPANFEKYRNQKMIKSRIPDFKQRPFVADQDKPFDKEAAERKKAQLMREAGL